MLAMPAALQVKLFSASRRGLVRAEILQRLVKPVARNGLLKLVQVRQIVDQQCTNWYTSLEAGSVFSTELYVDAFSAKLRSDRVRVGLTVRRLADQSGISFSYITKIETGRATKGVSPDIVTRLARVLKSDVLEYLHLSEVVPAPLNALLADEKSRSVLRAMLESWPDAAGWDRIRTAFGMLSQGKPGSRETSSPRVRKFVASQPHSRHEVRSDD